MEMRVERFGNKRVRFVEYNGEWWAVLKDICDRHNITLAVSYVNNMKLEMMNTKEIVFNAEYDYKVNKWLISINSVDRVDSDKFASQLSKVNEFFSCVQEAEAIDVREIYKYLSELEV